MDVSSLTRYYFLKFHDPLFPLHLRKLSLLIRSVMAQRLRALPLSAVQGPCKGLCLPLLFS